MVYVWEHSYEKLTLLIEGCNVKQVGHLLIFLVLTLLSPDTNMSVNPGILFRIYFQKQAKRYVTTGVEVQTTSPYHICAKWAVVTMAAVQSLT